MVFFTYRNRRETKQQSNKKLLDGEYILYECVYCLMHGMERGHSRLIRNSRRTLQQRRISGLFCPFLFTSCRLFHVTLSYMFHGFMGIILLYFYYLFDFCLANEACHRINQHHHCLVHRIHNAASLHFSRPRCAPKFSYIFFEMKIFHLSK